MAPYKSNCTGCKFIQRKDLSKWALPETHIYRCSFFDSFEMPLMFKAFFNADESQLMKSARQIEGPFDPNNGGQWTKCSRKEPANNRPDPARQHG